MEATQYLKNPCKMSSLPFWKTNIMTVPDNMVILRDDAFRQNPVYGLDEPYFRMQHHLSLIPCCQLSPAFELIDCNIEDYSIHICNCYEQEHVSIQDLTEYKNHPVFDPSLWICIAEKNTGHIVATGIAELDTSIDEGILEWIQVSPLYRRQGLGKYIVCELLKRMQERARFVTVSGKMKNESNPYALYRACGFDHPVIWHVVIK